MTSQILGEPVVAGLFIILEVFLPVRIRRCPRAYGQKAHTRPPAKG
nr:MAG TPA_asm: hypothetical protein [Caudoviricetes sp.]